MSEKYLHEMIDDIESTDRRKQNQQDLVQVRL